MNTQILNIKTIYKNQLTTSVYTKFTHTILTFMLDRERID